jgi:protein TonB
MSYLNPDKQHRSYRLVAVTIFHLALGWLLLYGFASKAIDMVSTPVDATLIDEVKKIPKPPSPKPIPKVFVPKAEVTPPPLSGPAIQATPTEPPSPMQASSAKLDSSSGCQKPEYPTSSRLSGEQGTVALSFLIGEDGSIRDSRIDKSSSFKSLDEAARAALSLCHFKPGLENGRPVASWARIRYVWHLVN